MTLAKAKAGANKTFIVQASLTYDCHLWLSKYFYSTGHRWWYLNAQQDFGDAQGFYFRWCQHQIRQCIATSCKLACFVQALLSNLLSIERESLQTCEYFKSTSLKNAWLRINGKYLSWCFIIDINCSHLPLMNSHWTRFSKTISSS